VRDELLAAGEHPGLWIDAEAAIRYRGLPDAEHLVGGTRDDALDGLTARAERYRRELAAGRWQLPDGWHGEGARTRPPAPRRQRDA